MQHEVYRLLQEARDNGATVFFSSHIISEVEAIADRIAIIRQGVIVEEAEPHQLVSMVSRRIRIRFREVVDPQPLTQVPGVSLISCDDTQVTVQVEGELDGLVKALAAYPVSDLETERPSLEELFLAYYEGDENREVA
jgi:ABC-2 type transport system ATP-binding protein